MKIALDDSPITQQAKFAHRVRGTGFYIDNLKKSLIHYYPKNFYISFSETEKIPKEIDIVHYPYFEPFFLSLPFKFSYPTVVTVHDLTPLVFPQYFPSGIKGFIKWIFQKNRLKNANAIITDSESSKKDILKYTGVSLKKIHVVYLAASDDFKQVKNNQLKQSIRKKYNLPKEFILYVGDATWNKNLPRLIKAVQQSNIILVMVGKAIKEDKFDASNPWNQDLVRINKLVRESKNIVRVGFVSHQELIAIYNMATLFIMPSLYEGFGLPLLEAMGCGCPVITTQEGSIPEIVGDSAFFVDAYNIDSIANGIKKVFSDKSLQNSLRKKGLERKQNFSWEKTARETQAIYDKVVGRK